jgi:hypothetical protein
VCAGWMLTMVGPGKRAEEQLAMHDHGCTAPHVDPKSCTCCQLVVHPGEGGSARRPTGCAEGIASGYAIWVYMLLVMPTWSTLPP